MAISNPSATLASASVHALWSVRLLGAVRANTATQTLSHWPSRAVAVLLARLAMAPERAHPREELIELLWPGVALDIGRNRLRQALSVLKGLLEPQGAPPVLLADRMTVRVQPGSITSDAVQFERLLRQADSAAARALYGGEFMPGFYEDWVLEERRRLAVLFEGLQASPPPVLPAPTPRQTHGSLPNFWTRMFGIEHSAARLRALVLTHRLVTVCGAGGSGKTRLAVEVAQALHEPSAWAPATNEQVPPFDQISFVSLVDCRDSNHAVDALAAALGVEGRDPLARITVALSGRRTLLLLDNYEQLVGRANDVLLRLLTENPALHLLITTRQRLGLDGEQTFELSGLPLPEKDSADNAASQPALALFVDRARAASADFHANASALQAVAELVQLLGGLPLAIELAATRIRSLAPRELLRRLKEDGGSPMLDLLARGASAGDQRHASMRHVVAWSLRQLSVAQMGMLEAMATFAAPAGIEAVAAVAATDEPSTLQGLEALHDSSLVQASVDARGSARWVLLQPVREFVVERMDAQVALRARQRLRRWLIEYGYHRVGPGDAAVAAAAELPHVMAAIVSASSDGAGRDAVEIAVAWRRYWDVHSTAPLRLSVMQVLEQAQAAVDDLGLRSEVCSLLAWSRQVAGFPSEAEALANLALALAPDARRRSLALTRWALAKAASSEPPAGLDAALEEAVALARSSGDKELQALALRTLALVSVNIHGNHVRGESLSAEAQVLWEQLGDRRNVYRRLQDRAICWAWLGRNDEAATALVACEQAALADGDPVGESTAAWQLGRVLVRLRQADAAALAFQRSIQVAWQHHLSSNLRQALLVVASALVLSGEPDKAARLLGFGVAHWLRLTGPLNRVVEPEIRRTRRLLRLKLGPSRAEALRVEGAGLSLAQAVALALTPRP